MKSKIFGPRELLEDVIQRNLCVGCGACVDLCPYFRSYRGKTAMLFPCDLPRGRCYAYCPKAEVDLDLLAQRFWGTSYQGKPLGPYLKILASRAGDSAPRGLFQAGGTVSAVTAFALQEGIIRAAVLTGREGLIPVSRLITEPREVVSCALSKYTAAPSLAALNRGLRDGFDRIGVVGTPCQVTAVAQMRTNPMEQPDFSDPAALVIGLFCTWALDTRALVGMLSERMDIGRIFKMDIPPPPAEMLVLETEDGPVKIPLVEVRPLIPGGCSVCPDMTAEWSDLSVGVMEGDAGWNTLIVRTEKGLDLLERASQSGWILTREMPEENLRHLEKAASNKRKRAFSAALEQGLVNAEGKGRACLRLNDHTLKKIMEQED